MDIRCLECGHVLDALCLTDGFEELFHDDADIDRDVCVTDGLVDLWCLGLLIRCLLCVHIPDEVCLTDGLVALRCHDVEIADVDCNVKVTDDCIADGLTTLDVVDGVFAVSVNLDVGYVENDAKG